MPGYSRKESLLAPVLFLPLALQSDFPHRSDKTKIVIITIKETGYFFTEYATNEHTFHHDAFFFLVISGT